MRKRSGKKRYVVGIDVGGTNLKIAIIGLDGKIYKKLTLPTKKFNYKKKLIDALASHSKKIINECGLAEKNILGVGIGTPGLVDSTNGVIHYLVNIKGFKEVPLKKIIESKLKLPTFLDNDVNMMCLGELCYGSGIGAKSLVCVALGTGVGGGIALEGNLYRGFTLSAGEIGHTTINEDGPLCNCGNKGCLEAYVGNSYIVKDAIRRIRQNKNSLIVKLVNGKLSHITPKIISKAAYKGDKTAKDVLRSAGSHIGVGLANIINVLNPEKIVIGGGVAEAGKILFDAIKASVRGRAMKVPAAAVEILKAKLGEDAGLIGAAALVLKEIG